MAQVAEVDAPIARDWMREARCARLDRGDYYFTEPTSRHRGHNWQMGRQRYSSTNLRRAERVAIACCAVCPVMRECLAHALRNAEVRLVTRVSPPDPRFEDSAEEVSSGYRLQGVWGGTTASERRGVPEADLAALYAWARQRATREGLAPLDALDAA